MCGGVTVCWVTIWVNALETGKDSRQMLLTQVPLKMRARGV